MPILGVIASGISGNLYSPSYESIVSYAPTSTTTSITFSAIPQTYKHLQIRAHLVSTSSENNYLNLNGDTASNYSWHQFQATGTSVDPYQSNPSPNPPWGLNSNNSSFPMVSIIDFWDYKDTNKVTTWRVLSGTEGAATNNTVGIYGGSWNNTNAVTTITLFNLAILSGSRFALYGIKDAL